MRRSYRGRAWLAPRVPAPGQPVAQAQGQMLLPPKLTPVPKPALRLPLRRPLRCQLAAPVTWRPLPLLLAALLARLLHLTSPAALWALCLRLLPLVAQWYYHLSQPLLPRGGSSRPGSFLCDANRPSPAIIGTVWSKM